MVKTKDWINFLGFDFDNLDDIRFTGFFYLKHGKYDIAKDFFEALVSLQACSLDEQNPYDYQMLGALYLELGNYKRALRYLDKSICLDPDNWSAKLNRLYCLFSLRRIDEGLDYAKSLMSSTNDKLSESAEAFVLAWSEEFI